MTAGHERDLAIAREAAAAARAIILQHYGGTLEVETKADRSPVTVADRAAEDAIRGVILEARPEDALLGEEHGRHGSDDAGRLWLVDPIDGTKSYVRGYGMFSTQVALMVGERIEVGVSLAPAMDECAWASRGGGAFRDGERLRVSDVAAIDEASISTGNLRSLARGNRWAALGAVLGRADRTRGYGDYYHYHRLAEGAIDAVIESDVNVLDIAALSLIVEEAGGVFTDLDGQPVGLETTSVLAANPDLHATLLEALSSAPVPPA